MKKPFIASFSTLAVLSFLAWNCQKSYSVAPLSPVAFTATFTASDTPCGYPGFTCTATSTYTFTSTGTPTSTPTITNTPLPTSTPTVTGTPTATPETVLAPPQDLMGWPETPQNYMQIFWAASTDPHVTSYKVYRGPSSSAMTFWGSVPQAAGPILTGTDTSTVTFNEYVCVTASGTLPDSPQSNVVHAVSGSTALNDVSVSVSSSLTPTLSILSGTVPGATQRVWLVFTPGGGTTEWIWGEQAAALTNLVYGFTGYGITYVPAAPLSPATTYNTILATFNSEYWCVDYSGVNFTTP